MLEILIVWQCCKKIGTIVRAKGRNPVGYQTLAAIFWITGEIFGAVVGLLMGGDEDGELLMYVMALLGAAVGMAVAFAIAAIVPDISHENPADAWDEHDFSCRSCGERLPSATETCPVCGETT